jgi:LacI family transcriptional regulator
MELSQIFLQLQIVSQSGIKMGSKAAKMLIDRLESEEHENENYRTEVIETHLIERESTN